MSESQRLLITGHHLEWLALVSRELRPSDRVLLAAGCFVLRTVSQLRNDQILERICECSHGLRDFEIAGIRIVDEP